MARPVWTGHLSFGLVMIPVSMFSAEEPLKELDFDLLDSRDGSKVRYIRVNENTGKEVDWKSIVKGVKRNGEYVRVTQDDFKRAAKDVTKGVEIVEFVKQEEINPLLYVKPYYLLPGKGGEKVYVLLRETMKKAGSIGIARMVIRSREHIAALMVVDEMLTLMTLRFPEELRAPADVGDPHLANVRVQSREVEMARQLVSGMTAEFEPGEFHDRYHDALKAIINRKAKSGGEVEEEPEEEGAAPESEDIVELLKKSLVGRRSPGRRPRTAKHPGKHAPRRKAG